MLRVILLSVIVFSVLMLSAFIQSVITMSVLMLSSIILSVLMLTVVTLSFTIVIVILHSAECHYAQIRGVAEPCLPGGGDCLRIPPPDMERNRRKGKHVSDKREGPRFP
jgi:hypothetical protein